MVVFIQLIELIGAKRLQSILTECLRSGTDYRMMAEVLETAANAELTESQLERLIAVLANGSYKSALALYKAS